MKAHLGLKLIIFTRLNAGRYTFNPTYDLVRYVESTLCAILPLSKKYKKFFFNIISHHFLFFLNFLIYIYIYI